jgi:hypothetical protein
MLSARNAEKESLKDQVETLKQDILQLEDELEQHDKAHARSERSINSAGAEKTREQLEAVSLLRSVSISMRTRGLMLALPFGFGAVRRTTSTGIARRRTLFKSNDSRTHSPRRNSRLRN